MTRDVGDALDEGVSLIHRLSAGLLCSRSLSEKLIIGDALGRVAWAHRRLSSTSTAAIGPGGPPFVDERAVARRRLALRDPRVDVGVELARWCDVLAAVLQACDPDRHGRLRRELDVSVHVVRGWSPTEPAGTIFHRADDAGRSVVVDVAPMRDRRRASACTPWRPAAWPRAPRPDAPVGTRTEVAASPRLLGQLFHFIVFEIELCVMEICAAMALDAPEQGFPADFVVDMADQISDEARHARFLSEGLSMTGVRPGEFAVSMLPWRTHQHFVGLEDQLIAQHVLSEGTGMDAALEVIAALRAAGRPALADAVALQNDDEVGHCATAIRWLLWANDGDGGAVAAKVRRVANVLGTVTPEQAPVTDERRRAGFHLISGGHRS